MKVSIIIPVKEVNDYIREAISHILKMDYEDYEIIIFPDVRPEDSFPKTNIIPTGDIGPAEKRDLAMRYARGEILAFLDDDAYPSTDWLSNAVRHFQDEDVAAVGGPAVTPRDDSTLQKASGALYASWLVCGGYEYRYVPGKTREVDDYPTVNLLVRKNVFKRLGGFDSNYWPGEDTKLCFDITRRLKKKIIYDPDVLVCHHRRPLFLEHLRQVSRYAFHRGYFVKVLPGTSMRLGYFVPSLFVLGLIIGAVLLPVHKGIVTLYAGTIILYVIMILVTAVSVSLRERDLKVGALTIPGIFLTHLTYGYNFLRGLSSGKHRR